MKDDEEFEIDAETTRSFQPGWGQTGKTVKITSIQLATIKYTDLSLSAVYCPRCEYDRAKVTIDHNPEAGDTIEIQCHTCHLDIVDRLERKEAQIEEERESNRRSDR